MDEARWLGCTDLQALLTFLRGRVSERKLRLFAIACCRRLDRLVISPEARAALEVAERFAEGQASPRDLRLARRAVRRRSYEWFVRAAAEHRASSAAEVVAEAVPLAAAGAVTSHGTPLWSFTRTAEQRALCVLLREVVGNPFTPSRCEPAWLEWNGGCVLGLVQSIYEERAFERLPILADALEDAGCADPSILTHCRAPSGHVRGCWVVDLLLSKG
jgi:hypothetical protein